MAEIIEELDLACKELEDEIRDRCEGQDVQVQAQYIEYQKYLDQYKEINISNNSIALEFQDGTDSFIKVFLEVKEALETVDLEADAPGPGSPPNTRTFAITENSAARALIAQSGGGET